MMALPQRLRTGESIATRSVSATRTGITIEKSACSTGSGTVTSLYADGAQQVVRYHNRDFHTRGLVRGSELWGPHADSESRRYLQTDYVVQQRSEGWYSGKEVVFAFLSSETRRQYEPGSESFAQRRTAYSYDDYGNIRTLEDDGDSARDGDELYARIEYAELPGYLKQHPASLRVQDAGGRLLRFREGEYGDRGELRRVQRYESEWQGAAYTLSWDDYGNLTAVEDPRGYRLGWQYDDAVHALPGDRPQRERDGGAIQPTFPPCVGTTASGGNWSGSMSTAKPCGTSTTATVD